GSLIIIIAVLLLIIIFTFKRPGSNTTASTGPSIPRYKPTYNVTEVLENAYFGIGKIKNISAFIDNFTLSVDLRISNRGAIGLYMANTTINGNSTLNISGYYLTNFSAINFYQTYTPFNLSAIGTGNQSTNKGNFSTFGVMAEYLNIELFNNSIINRYKRLLSHYGGYILTPSINNVINGNGTVLSVPQKFENRSGYIVEFKNLTKAGLEDFNIIIQNKNSSATPNISIYEAVVFYNNDTLVRLESVGLSKDMNTTSLILQTNETIKALSNYV
ncbi:MAG: hypothetical protein ACP5LP_00035, partial [Candidatus Micrarchaeia archaeon]